MGGASNSKGGGQYRYVLFGTQEDAQHPENGGVYFEYDDQSNGAINCVKAVSVGGKSVRFELKAGKSIEVTCEVSSEEWESLKQGIRAVFPPDSISFSVQRNGGKRG